MRFYALAPSFCSTLAYSYTWAWNSQLTDFRGLSYIYMHSGDFVHSFRLFAAFTRFNTHLTDIHLYTHTLAAIVHASTVVYWNRKPRFVTHTRARTQTLAHTHTRARARKHLWHESHSFVSVASIAIVCVGKWFVSFNLSQLCPFSSTKCVHISKPKLLDHLSMIIVL